MALLVGEFGEVIFAVPLKTDQEPVPMAGIFPFKVMLGLLAHKV